MEAVRRSLKPLPSESAATAQITPDSSALGQLLCKRRSARTFSGEPIPQASVERLALDCAGGVMVAVDSSGATSALYRTIPQSGGICSIGLIIVLLRSSGVLTPGVYRLCPHSNSLHKIGPSIDREVLVSVFGMADDTSALDTAAGIFIITADLAAKAFKYSTRGHRFALIEVGCALQNTLLSMCDQSVVGYPQGGFDDRRLANILRLNYPQEAAFVTIFMGMSSSYSLSVSQ